MTLSRAVQIKLRPCQMRPRREIPGHRRDDHVAQARIGRDRWFHLRSYREHDGTFHGAEWEATANTTRRKVDREGAGRVLTRVVSADTTRQHRERDLGPPQSYVSKHSLP